MGLSNGIAPVRKTARTVRNVYRRARDLARAGGANDSSDEATQWVRCYRSAKLDPAMVLYQTHSGASMSCNPYAIFRALLDDPEFAHLKHVWVLDSYAEIGLRSAEYAGHPNVTFVRFKTREYLEALASAGYLIQNTTFPSYFTKRPGQVYVNTWHSAGAVKKMGFDLPQGNYVSRNVLRDLMMADFIVAPNALMARMYAESFRLRGLYRGTILDFGYPRNDVTLNTPPAGVLDELRQRGVRVDPAKKVILYAPTWRGTIGNVRAGVDELEQFRATLAERIDSDDYQIPIKPHLYHYNQLTGEQRLSGQYIPRHFNTNGLLAAVDILVSDYSSIFFDFMVTGRPILFFVPDLVEYTRERGLYFTPDELPGPVTDDPAAIAGWINDLDATVDAHAERYARVRALACAHEDGRSARRTVDAVFRGRRLDGVTDGPIEPDRQRLLFYAPDLDSHGATEALLALVGAFDRTRYDISVAGIGHGRASRDNLERITDARVFVRVGGSALTRHEARALAHLERYGPTDRLSRMLRPEPVLEREWRRRFGDAEFDVIVDCSRYPSTFAWMAKLNSRARLVVWQHTDVAADLRHRGTWRHSGAGAPAVTEAALAAVYRAADAVVAPSPELLAGDRASFPGVRTFAAAESPVDVARVRRLLAEAEAWRDTWRSREDLIVADVVVDESGAVRTLQLDDTPPSPETGQPYRRFVTMGSLSPEKNQANLVTAFGDFVREHPNSRLFVIGAGPAARELRQLAARLGLTGRVCFTGYLRNPFTVLGRCDCFVLPSEYEGFSLAVCEARLAGLAIVLAGFASAPSVSVPDGQLVTGFTADELHAGLRAYADGRVRSEYAFDADAHNAAGLAQWEAIVGRAGAQSARG